VKFVALLEPANKCKQGCNSTGLIRLHIHLKGIKDTIKQAVCPCCKVIPLSADPDEALEELARLTGRSIKKEEIIITPAEFIDDARKRVTV